MTPSSATAQKPSDAVKKRSEADRSAATDPAGGSVAPDDAPTRKDAPAPDDPSTATFKGPLVISAGGTYRGNWKSDDASTPAVSIRTTEPVTIEGSNIRSRGHLIASAVKGTNVTVRNTVGVGLPPGEDGQEVGRFVSLHGARKAVIEGNTIKSTAGIEFIEYGGNGSAGQTFKVRYNHVRNIDGRVGKGNGLSNVDDAAALRQFVQFNRVSGAPGVEVAWNEVHNIPGESRVEDNISIYISGGLPGDPIDIHHNFIDGAYPADPTSDDYSGGGIMAGDGVGDGAPAHVLVRDNRVLNTTNYGIAISSGRNMRLRNNRVLSNGRTPEGDIISAQNVGAYVWNMLGADFGNNSITDNVVGWEKPRDGTRNDYWLPDASSKSGNTSLPGRVTEAVLDAEHAAWLADAASAGVHVGVAD